MEKQAALRWSAGTANTPSTQSPSSSSSKRSTCVFEKIRKLVWRQQTAPSAHSPKMSWGFIIKLLLTNNSISFIVFFYCDKNMSSRVKIQSSLHPFTPLLSRTYGHVTIFTSCKKKKNGIQRMDVHTCSLLALSLNVNRLLNCRNVPLCRKQSKHVYVPGLRCRAVIGALGD